MSLLQELFSHNPNNNQTAQSSHSKAVPSKRKSTENFTLDDLFSFDDSNQLLLNTLNPSPGVSPTDELEPSLRNFIDLDRNPELTSEMCDFSNADHETLQLSCQLSTISPSNPDMTLPPGLTMSLPALKTPMPQNASNDASNDLFFSPFFTTDLGVQNEVNDRTCFADFFNETALDTLNQQKQKNDESLMQADMEEYIIGASSPSASTPSECPIDIEDDHIPRNCFIFA
jgi:hypothetical protein